MRLLLLVILYIALLPSLASAKPIIADISTNRIEIDSGFTGTELLLFGARNDIGDIVVVVRGQNKDYIVRKKEKIGGIWVNRDQFKIRGVPNYYSIASSRPLEEINLPKAFAPLAIGMEYLIQAPEDSRVNFYKAFLSHQEQTNVYNKNEADISFMGETLFKIPLFFPDTTPEGVYVAEVYLFDSTGLVAVDSTPIRVVKTGFDAFIHKMAHHSPVTYGILALAIALAVGWGAGALFEKL